MIPFCVSWSNQWTSKVHNSHSVKNSASAQHRQLAWKLVDCEIHSHHSAAPHQLCCCRTCLDVQKLSVHQWCFLSCRPVRFDRNCLNKRKWAAQHQSSTLTIARLLARWRKQDEFLPSCHMSTDHQRFDNHCMDSEKLSLGSYHPSSGLRTCSAWSC